MTCADVMSSNPSCCTGADSVFRAAEIMKAQDVGSVPVVSSQTDRYVIGIVTDRDLAMRLIAEGRAPEATTVSDVMSKDPVTCRIDDDVHEAMETMSKQQIRRVPVVDEEGRLRGIIAQADIARWLGERETGEVVEDISQPGRNAVGRAFHKARSSMQGLRSGGQNRDWLVALAVGAAVGAGVMAAVDQRRLSSSKRSYDYSRLSSQQDIPDEEFAQPIY